MTESGTDIRRGAWHQSGLDLLVHGCAWKWHLTYNEGLESGTSVDMEAGTAAHAAVEAHEKTRWLWFYTKGRMGNPAGIDTVAMRAEATMYLDSQYSDDDEQLAEARDKAWAAIDHWVEHVKPRVMEWRVVAVEPYFRVWRPDLAGRPLAGWIDAVYLKPDGQFVLVDLKTAGSLGYWKHDAEGKRLQATMYSLAAMQALNLPIRDLPRFEYHVVRTRRGQTARFQPSRIIEVELDRLDVAALEQTIEQAEGIVASGDYAPNPDWHLCSPRFCVFHGTPDCPATEDTLGTYEGDPFAGLVEE